MPGSYADLLREAQARQNAEARAEAAESKLTEIAELNDQAYTDGWSNYAHYSGIKAILGGDQ